MLFFLLTICAYRGYVNERIPGKRQFHYVLTLSFFVAALMSKANAATLPFVLLLLDYWPLERFKVSGTHFQITTIWAIVWEKIPFFVLSAVFSWLVSDLLRKEGGTQNFGDIPLWNRAASGTISYARYLGKLVWPVDLSVFYPRLSSWPLWQLAASFLLVFGCTILAILYVRRRPSLFVGWFWFVGTIFPVAGIVHQLGGHAMADRYTYISYTGLFIGISFAPAEIFSRNRLGTYIAAALAVLVLGILFALTNVQAQYWQNSETLFRHALAVNKNDAVAHNFLGSALMDQGKLKEAEEHFAEALRIRPEFPFAQINFAQINYGVALARGGKVEEGVGQLLELLKKRPNDEDAHYGLGLILQEKGDFAGAIEQYETASRLKPEDADALNNLAWIRAANGDAAFRNGDEAVRLARRACDLTRFRRPVMIGTLAAAYAEAGQFKEAVAMAARAQAVAQQIGQTEVADRNGKLLELYRAGRPYREER